MIVLDASAAVEALTNTEVVGARVRAVLGAAEGIAVPDFFDAEVASGVRRRWLRGTISAEEFAAALADLREFAAERYPSRELVQRAFELRANVTAYDACYVGLAESLGVPLHTCDGRLSRAPGIRCEIRVLSGAA